MIISQNHCQLLHDTALNMAKWSNVSKLESHILFDDISENICYSYEVGFVRHNDLSFDFALVSITAYEIIKNRKHFLSFIPMTRVKVMNI